MPDFQVLTFSGCAVHGAARDAQQFGVFLTASNDEFRQLLDAAPDALVVLDAQGLVVALNDEAERYFGWREEELLGEPMLRFIPEHVQYLFNGDREVAAGWPPASTDWTPVSCFARRRDGSEFPVELSRRPLGSAADARSLVMLRDLTQWRRAQETRSHNNAEARATLEAIGDAVVTSDLMGLITYLNPVAERLTGWTEREALGQSLDAVMPLISESTRLPVANTAKRSLTENRAVDLEDGVVLLRRDGTEVPVGDSAAPVRDGAGVAIGVVMVIQDESEKRRVGHRLSHEASHDSLTGLMNRRQFERRLSLLLSAPGGATGEHVILCLDLDRFKSVNDSCGHEAGDALLRSLGKLLAGQLRRHDTLARLGGDEFGVLLEDCPLAEAERIAENIRLAFEQYRFEWHGQVFTVGVSIGMIAITGGDGDIATVLRLADAACYAAKEAGGNSIHRHVHTKVAETRALGLGRRVTRLVQAVETGEFQLYAQPIVPLQPDASQARRFEILLRLPDGHGGMLKAAEFLPQAERYSLMPAIDLWVVERTVALLGEWRLLHPGSVSPICSINLSASAIAIDGFVAAIARSLANHAVPASSLCFEVAESAMVTNFARSVQFFASIRKLGCGIALEDYAVSVASLTSLKSLPVDFLKIGGQFVGKVAVDPMYGSIVSAVSQIGRSIGISTIAKQVGTEQSLRMLQTLGVGYAQGKAIVPPMPFTDEEGRLLLPQLHRAVQVAQGEMTGLPHSA